MLPNLSQLSVGTTGPSRKFPRETQLPDEIVDQIVKEAARKAAPLESVLITYIWDGDCPVNESLDTTPVIGYEILTFDELRRANTPSASSLLGTFRKKLTEQDSSKSKDPDPIELTVSFFGGAFDGLADLLTDDQWPHGEMAERFLSETMEARSRQSRGRPDRFQAVIELTEPINKRIFDNNREALATFLNITDPDDLENWWTTFVEEDVKVYFGTDVKAKAKRRIAVDENKIWQSLQDVKVQHFEPWVTQVYQPAGDWLLSKLPSATLNLPLFVPRIRLNVFVDNV